jgi:glycosyltransferase involved in cell wall biosynthesis
MAHVVNVLLVDHVSALGGAEFSLEALVDRMPAERCLYTVVLPGPGPFADLLARKNVRVKLVRHESWRWWVRSGKQVVKFFLTLPLQATSMVRWIRFLQELRPDLVHFNVSRLVEPMVAARALGIPMVIHFRDIPSRQRHRFVLGRRVFYRLLNLVDGGIANSKATADDIRRFCHRPLFEIPNGLDVAEFDRSRLAHQGRAATLLQPARHHVAMLGGINPTKRQLDFVEMAVRVLRDRQDTVFYLVGGEVDSDYSTRLRAIVESAGFSSSVRFLGSVDCIPSFLSYLDILVHTTPFEGFGRVFLEAMAAGRPVVAINSGGAAEVVVDGVTGILIPAGAAEQLAQAINALLDDETTRRQMGAAGRHRVETQYSIEAHCAAVADVYDAVVRH